MRITELFFCFVLGTVVIGVFCWAWNQISDWHHGE